MGFWRGLGDVDLIGFFVGIGWLVCLLVWGFCLFAWVFWFSLVGCFAVMNSQWADWRQCLLADT